MMYIKRYSLPFPQYNNSCAQIMNTILGMDTHSCYQNWGQKLMQNYSKNNFGKINGSLPKHINNFHLPGSAVEAAN